MNQVTVTLKSRYTLIQTLGEGVLGTAYLARDTLLERTVCIKIIKQELALDKEFTKKLYTEIARNVSLKYSLLNSPWDIDISENNLFIISEYAETGSLGASSHNKILSEEELLPIAVNTAQALSVLHDNNIIHAGLKPQNILFSSENGIKLSDASVNNALYPEHINNYLLNNPAGRFLAPDRKKGEKASFASDIYEFGAVFFEKLNGSFTGNENFESDLETIAISSDFRQILLKCLSCDPNKQYKNAGELVSDLIKHQTRELPPLDNEYSGIQTEKRTPDEKIHQKTSDDVKENIKDIRHLSALIITLAAITAAVIIGIVLFFSVNELQELKTPDFIGKKLPDAQILASRKGLYISIEKEMSANKEKGVILNQSPPPGSAIKSGRIIYITVSKGKNSFEMPSLKGLSIKEATERLQALGISKIKVMREYSAQYSAEIIINHLPRAGYIVDKTSVVTLTASKGKTSDSFYPDITGKTEIQAKEILEKIGLKLLISAQEHSETVKAGLIISQTPLAGTQIQGKEISVTISKGIEKIIAPALTGSTLAQAKKIVEGLGIKLVFEPTLDDESIITDQVPPAGHVISDGSIIIKAETMVSVPSCLGVTLEEIKNLIESAGLIIGELTYKESPGPENIVLEQNPPAGESVVKGSGINFVISSKFSDPPPEKTHGDN